MKKLISFFIVVVVALLVAVAFPTVANEEWIWAFPTGAGGSSSYTNFQIQSNEVFIIEANSASINGYPYNDGILIAKKGPLTLDFSLVNGIQFITTSEKAKQLFEARYQNLVRNNYARRNILPLTEWNWSPDSDSNEEWLYSSIPPWGYSTGWIEASINESWVDLKQSCNNALVVANRSNDRIQIRYRRSNPNDQRDRSLVTIYGSGNSLESIKSVYASQMNVPISHLTIRYLPN